MQANIEAGYPEWLWSLHPWSYSKPNICNPGQRAIGGHILSRVIQLDNLYTCIKESAEASYIEPLLQKNRRKKCFLSSQLFN